MKVYLGGVRYTIKDTDGVYEPKSVKFVEQRVPVSTGGSFTLANGRTLYINGEDEYFDPWNDGDGYTGIYMYLSSGEDLMAYLLNWESGRAYSSYHGMFYDMDGMYNDGNIIKLYAIDISECYSSSIWSFSEDEISSLYQMIALLQLEDDEWVLKDIESMGDRVKGHTFTLNNGSSLFISGWTSIHYGEAGVYYTINDGSEIIAYYHRAEDDLCNESNYGWIGLPWQDAWIHDYDYITFYFGDMYDRIVGEYDGDYSEENAENVADYSVRISYRNNEWRIDHDYS